MYKNYIFDFYGTLANIKANENNPFIWEKLSIFYNYNNAIYTSNELFENYNLIFNKYKNLYCHIDFPDFPIENIFKELYLIKNINPSDDLVINTSLLYRSLVIEEVYLYHGVKELLSTLKEKNKNIYLLSNAQKLFTYKEIEFLGISHFFNNFLFSSEENTCKPSIDFFNKLITTYSLDVNKTIMIGNDYFADIKPANKLKIDTLYIHSNLSPSTYIKGSSTFEVLNGNVNDIKNLIIK